MRQWEMEACGQDSLRGKQNCGHSRLALKPQAKPPVRNPFPIHYVCGTKVAAFQSQLLKEPKSTHHMPPVSQFT